MRGKFLFSREIIQDKALFSNRLDFIFLTLLISNAAFKNIEIEGVNIKRGQYLRSMRQISEDLAYIENKQIKKYSLNTIKRSILRLEKLGYIKTKESGQLGTLFTIQNYDELQRFEEPEHGTPKPPNAEHQNAERGTRATKDKAASLLDFEKQNNGTWNTKPPNMEHQNAEHGTKRTNEYLITNELITNENNSALSENEHITLFAITEKYKTIFRRDMTFKQREIIESYLDDGLEIEAVNYAIEKAAENAAYPSYINKLLSDWFKQGIRTLEEAKNESKGKKGQGQKRRGTAPQYEYNDKKFRF